MSGDLLYTHNDSGDEPRFFAVDRTGRTRATYTLAGLQTRDWEAVSKGPGKTLWFGDIGDNSVTRDRGLLVHRVAEPTGGSRQLTPTTYRLRYEDGPRDAEALIVTPRTGQVIVVEKTLGSRAGVYVVDAPLRPGGVVNLLRRVAEVPVPSVTAGDVSPDGTRVVLRNYTAAYEWDVPDGDVVRALGQEPARIPLPPTAQGEGIAYDDSGTALLTSSEGAGAPVHELRRAAAPSPPADEPEPEPEPEPEQVRRTGEGWRAPLVAAGVALVCVLVTAMLRRRGR